MAGAHVGKGGAPGGKGGARNGNGGARSGNGGVRSGNDGAPSGDGRSGNDGARSGNDRAYGGNGGAPSGNGGTRSGNDGAPSGNGGTRGRTPKQGFRPPSRQVHDSIDNENIDDGTFMTTCGRYSALRGARTGNIVSVNVRGGSRGGHNGSGSRGGHDGSGKRGGRGGHDGSGRRGGYAGSSSRQGEGDPIADMCGVFRDPSLRTIPDCDSNHYSEDSDFEDVDHQEADLEDVNCQEADLEDDEHPLSQRSYEGASGDTNQGRMIRRAGDKYEKV
ncbi:hypothetical protein Hdeb2414_s0285g00857341 [Helianthus debilis subsp. tardiflorus]